MKKAKLINSGISYIVSTMGHGDGITVCDAGLPIPGSTQRIDLAVTRGIPTFMETVKAIASELEIEGVEMAEEFKEKSPELHRELLVFLETIADERGKPVLISYIPHEEFKANTEKSLAVVRTGECTPFANVTLKSGVVF
ncbi:MAG: D-ribose pyranase [Desulfovibrio sp.]|nr:D-ribose pyranase [Desulfovibrio sp.]|tara:strand:- start:5296 stop:5715 length:420 start_codon:yes stop_codon:yes gene_type:complete